MQVDRGIEFFSRRYRCAKFIAYFQSFTNTYGEVEHLARIYSQATRRPEIVGLALGTRPDCVPDRVLDLLENEADKRTVWIEFGLQSVHRDTLSLIRRGHGPEAFFDAIARTRKRNLDVVVHLILGLPGESLEKMIETAKAVSGAGVQGVKLHPLYVVNGTELGRMYLAGSYRPMTEQEAVDATLAVLEVLPEDMVIHRMTSDPHPEELLAPKWMLDRRGVRLRLERTMEDRDFRQGSRANLITEDRNSCVNALAAESEATPIRSVANRVDPAA